MRVRLRLGRMMAVVVVAAVDLVVARAFVDPHKVGKIDVVAMLEVVPFVLVLHAALIRSGIVKGRDRLFWIGFLVAGVVSVGFVLAANEDPPRETRIITSTGITISNYPGDVAARVVWGYHGMTGELLEKLRYPYIEFTSGLGGLATWVIICIVPQCLIAWAGGIAAVLGYTRFQKT
ncbi:MAG: hypothetical protein P4L84_19520 [Isosphaeraceae bacterium]|nr:hypothetical protein [Isosphaeraceae bacterium]